MSNLPGVQMVGSLLRRWLTDPLRYAVSQEHLAYYWTSTRSGSTGTRHTSNSRGLLFYGSSSKL